MSLRFSLAKAAGAVSTWGLRHVARRPAANLPGKIALAIDPSLLDELRGKQIGHTRRPLNIANRGNSAAEHFERRATVRVGRMPALALRPEHDIGIALLGKIGMHKPTLACAVLGSLNDTIVALSLIHI